MSLSDNEESQPLTWPPDVVRWPQNLWVDGGSHKVPAASAPEELGDARYKKNHRSKAAKKATEGAGRKFKKQLSLHLSTLRPGCIRQPHARGHRVVFGASWKEKDLRPHMENSGVWGVIPVIFYAFCASCVPLIRYASTNILETAPAGRLPASR
jgi:hypothetical protein